jgi:hypothetical protein
MNKVCIVPIFGDYDTLKEPTVISDGWKYICISDRHHKSKVWKTKILKADTTNKRKSGYVLTQLHRIIDFDIACVVGGQIQINTDLNKYIEDVDFISLDHPSRNCIYKEAQACILYEKDDPKVIARQMYKYLESGYPVNNGMIQTGVTFRKDSNLIRTFMNHWWHEIQQGSHRDQLSFNYILDKYKISTKELSSNLLRNEFRLNNHNENSNSNSNMATS